MAKWWQNARMGKMVPGISLAMVQVIRSTAEALNNLRSCTNLTVSVGQGSMEEREEMPEQKREAVELLASSNVVGGSYVPPHMRGQVIPFRKSFVNFNGSSVWEGNSKTQN